MIDTLPSDQRRALGHFADLVASSPHNLVSRRAREELWSRHIPESVALARLLPADRPKVLDLGSGGGFPGLVIAIVRPDLAVTLLDATRKKTDFLRRAAKELDVTVDVETGRAEELGSGSLSGRFQVVTARAVAPLARLIPWGLPFLETGGLLYAVKGERWAEELDDAAAQLRRAGGQVIATPDEIATGDGDEASAPRVVIISRVR